MSDETTDAADADDRRDRERAAALGRAAVDGVTTALVLAKPEFGPFLAPLAEPAKQVLERMLGLANSRREERVVYAIITGTDHVGMSLQVLERKCEDNPKLAQLFTKIVIEAQDAIYREKLDALARCLSAALEDVARVDEELLYATVLGQLEPPHVRLLAWFEVNPAGTVIAPNASPAQYPNIYYNSNQLALLDPGLANVIEPLKGILISSGLIEITRTGSGLVMVAPGATREPYALTDFGAQVLHRIRSHNLTDKADNPTRPNTRSE